MPLKNASQPVPVDVALLSAKPVRSAAMTESYTIDCADCAHRLSSVCDDCIVSFIVGREPEDAVVVDADEARAVRLLHDAGMVPAVRHSRSAG